MQMNICRSLQLSIIDSFDDETGASANHEIQLCHQDSIELLDLACSRQRDDHCRGRQRAENIR